MNNPLIQRYQTEAPETPTTPPETSAEHLPSRHCWTTCASSPAMPSLSKKSRWIISSSFQRPAAHKQAGRETRNRLESAAISALNTELPMITIACPRVVFSTKPVPLLDAAGIVPLENPESSRKLIIGTNRDDVRLIIVRASDVPTYVQYGAADLGVAGRDVLIEHGGSNIYQPLDLEIAKCRLMVAVPEGFDYEGAVRRGAPVCG